MCCRVSRAWSSSSAAPLSLPSLPRGPGRSSVGISPTTLIPLYLSALLCSDSESRFSTKLARTLFVLFYLCMHIQAYIHIHINCFSFGLLFIFPLFAINIVTLTSTRLVFLWSHMGSLLSPLQRDKSRARKLYTEKKIT